MTARVLVVALCASAAALADDNTQADITGVLSTQFSAATDVLALSNELLLAQAAEDQPVSGSSRVPGFSLAGGVIGLTGGVGSLVLSIVGATQYDAKKDDKGTSDSHDDTWNYEASAIVLPFVANGVHLVSSHTAFWAGKSTRKRAGVRGLVALRAMGAFFGIVCAAELSVQPILAAAGERIRGTPIVLGGVAGAVSNLAFAIDDFVINAQAKRKVSSTVPDLQKDSGPRLSVAPYVSPLRDGARVGVVAAF